MTSPASDATPDIRTPRQILNTDFLKGATSVAEFGRGTIRNPLMGDHHRVAPMSGAPPTLVAAPAEAIGALDPGGFFIAPLVGSLSRPTRSSRSPIGRATLALAVIALFGGGIAALVVADTGKGLSAEVRHGVAAAEGQLRRLEVVARASVEH